MVRVAARLPQGSLAAVGLRRGVGDGDSCVNGPPQPAFMWPQPQSSAQ